MNLKFISCILDLIYPVVCFNCGNALVTHEAVICSICAIKLPRTNFHLDPVNEMAKTLWGRVNVDFATAFLHFRKAGMAQNLLHQLKYGGRRDIGINLGHRFGIHIRENSFISQTDYLIPVPLHISKLRMRGYNQSNIICNGMMESLGIPVFDHLQRVSYTETQTSKKRFDRWLNVSQKFVLNHDEMLEGKRVLLVDDVFTTGATIEACCEVLASVNEISIGVATLAIASG